MEPLDCFRGEFTLSEENSHKGHRQRVKQRYFETGFDNMSDYEVMEMLLFFGIPFKDTSLTAKALIDKFGSLSCVLEADVKSLTEIKGMTENAACLINMLLPIYRRYCKSKAESIVAFSSLDDIVRFLKLKFLDSTSEKVFALCLDNAMRLITSKQIAQGDAFGAGFDIQELVRLALDTKSCSIILAHNHLNSISTPSIEDVHATVQARDALRTLGIKLSDHLILSENGFCSMANTKRFADIFS